MTKEKVSEDGERYYPREYVTVTDSIKWDKELHYDIIKKWWAFYYNGDVLPKPSLPDTGALITYKGDPAAVAFIYTTNSNIAQIHFVLANPELGAGRKLFFAKQAVERAIDMAKELVGLEGFIWCCTDHASVARIYSDLGLYCSGEADIFFASIGGLPNEFLK